MKKIGTSVVNILMLLAFVSILANCGGGGGGGGAQPLQAPAAKLAGTWAVTTTTGNNTCGDPAGSTSQTTVQITHAEGSNSFTVTVQSDGSSFPGTVSGSAINFSRSYPENGGTTDDSYSCTLNTAQNPMTMTGTSSWTWSNGASNCSGTDSVTAVLTSSGNTTTSGSDTTPPSVPTGLTVTAVSSSQINLSWTASTDNVGVAGYTIYRGGTLLKTATGIFTSDTGLIASTQYCYQVSAEDAAGNESSRSAQQCASTLSGGAGGDTTPPSVPINLNAAAASSSQVNLSWNASTDNVGVAGYKIFSGTGTFLMSVATTSALVTGLSPSTQYCYKVSAFDAANNESAPCAQQCVATFSAPPSVPTGLTATAVSSSQIDLSWAVSTNDTGVAGYKIYSSTGTYIKSVPGTLTSMTGLSTSTQYCYKVSAYDVANNESATCAQQCATTLATTSLPAGPTNVSAVNITPTSALMTWADNSSNETGFEIGTCSGLISSSGNLISCMSGFTKVGQVGVNATSYPLTGLTSSTPYKYFVRANNSAGSSSNLGIAFTTATPPPAARYVRIVNDLYDQTTGNNLWGTWNTIIRVRIATTQSAVLNDSTNTYEKLAPYDTTSFVSNLNAIEPRYLQTTSYEDFSVSSLPSNYYVFLQTGWWDYDAWTWLWNKHVTAVLCCDGLSTCYKWATVSVTGHTSGTEIINASQFLPQGNWYGSGAPFCQ